MSGILNMSVTQGVKEGGKFLEPGIKDVTFKGIRKNVITGKDSSKTFTTLEMVFDIDGYGEYAAKLFEPTSADRTTSQFGENVITNASQVESFMLSLRHLLDTANPVAAKGIDDGTTVISGNFDQIITLVSNLVSGFIGKKTQIKLLPNKEGYANMPSGFQVAKVNKSGQLYLATRFIGDNLTLSANEVTAISKAAAARQSTPTNMGSNSTLSGMSNDFNLSDETDDLPF